MTTRHCWYDSVLSRLATKFPLGQTMTLEEIYEFEPELMKEWPRNTYVREQIRKQIGVYCDNGILRRIRPGVYRWRITGWINL